jgi:hypothetical protein
MSGFPFNGRTGAVEYASAGVDAGGASTAPPAQTGAPYAPTAAPAITAITQLGEI